MNCLDPDLRKYENWRGPTWNWYVRLFSNERYGPCFHWWEL